MSKIDFLVIDMEKNLLFDGLQFIILSMTISKLFYTQIRQQTSVPLPNQGINSIIFYRFWLQCLT